ncbi:MAG: MOSC domain-containing protein [Acidobacteria bacterium]|nr:MOSC domain-containing protein [Acidobacteriota bacterium]
MFVKEIWRYPVKSMAGERLPAATLAENGIDGDRNVLVIGANRRMVTARTHHKLLGLRGGIAGDGETTINGLRWKSPEALELVRDTLGEAVLLTHYNGPERFDILPLLLATDGAIEHMKLDGRRLRPNIVIGGVTGLAERGWPGRDIAIGEALVQPAQLRGRCVMTTFEPDTLRQDMNVLRRIAKELDGTMGLDTAVLRGGRIAEGDSVLVGASS